MEKIFGSAQIADCTNTKIEVDPNFESKFVRLSDGTEVGGTLYLGLDSAVADRIVNWLLPDGATRVLNFKLGDYKVKILEATKQELTMTVNGEDTIVYEVRIKGEIVK